MALKLPVDRNSLTLGVRVNNRSAPQLYILDTPGSHRSFATSASIASGAVVDAQRWTTLPCLSMRNFSKFHCERHTVNGLLQCSNEAIDACLDTGHAKKTALLILEPFVYLICVVAIDVGFLHQGKRDAVVNFTELRNGIVVAGLLTSELVIQNVPER